MTQVSHAGVAAGSDVLGVIALAGGVEGVGVTGVTMMIWTSPSDMVMVYVPGGMVR